MIRSKWAWLVGLWLGSAAAAPLGPGFTYQGELRNGGVAAQGNHDFEFRLFDAATGGNQIGAVVVRPAVSVSDGLFNTELDFGAAQFAGDAQWLEIRLRPAGSGAYQTLSPRTPLTAAPYAWAAAKTLTNSVTGLSLVDGSVGAADVDSSQVQRRVSGGCAAGSSIRSIDASGSVLCETDDSGNGVTAITAGAGLSGGTITTTGTLAIASNAVTGGMLQDGTVGVVDINTAQVQARVSGSCAAGQYMRSVDAGGTVVCGTPAFNGWSLGGNAGTSPATQFVGTTDAQPLVLATQGTPALRLFPSSTLYNGVPATSNLIGGSSANAAIVGVRGATIGGGGLPVGGSDPELPNAGPNQVTDHFGTVSGGYNNIAGDGIGAARSAAVAFVGGGNNNVASGEGAVVVGGQFNRATGLTATVGGGYWNWSLETSAAVAGGIFNVASGKESYVAGGRDNTASGLQSAVAGGTNNDATGTGSAVGGGSDNCAGGFSSWVAGVGAVTRPGTSSGDPGRGCAGITGTGDSNGDEGSFVWADTSPGLYATTAPKQFLVRAEGGAVISGAGNVNDPAGNRLRVAGTLRVDTLGPGGSQSVCRNAANQIASCSSSARYKQAVADLDGALGLQAAQALRPVSFEWRGSGEADLGFIAEEVAQLDPRLVVRNESGEVEGVKYDRLSAVLALAVQQLATARGADAARIARMQARIESLADRVEALERGP